MSDDLEERLKKFSGEPEADALINELRTLRAVQLNYRHRTRHGKVLNKSEEVTRAEVAIERIGRDTARIEQTHHDKSKEMAAAIHKDKWFRDPRWWSAISSFLTLAFGSGVVLQQIKIVNLQDKLRPYAVVDRNGKLIFSTFQDDQGPTEISYDPKSFDLKFCLEKKPTFLETRMRSGVLEVKQLPASNDCPNPFHAQASMLEEGGDPTLIIEAYFSDK